MGLSGSAFVPKWRDVSNNKEIPIGYWGSIGPAIGNDLVEVKGLGGLSKKRTTNVKRDWSLDLNGITSYLQIKAGLADNVSKLPPELEIYFNDLLAKGARVASFSLSGSQGGALTASFSGQFINAETVTPGSAPEQGQMFIYSDGFVGVGATAEVADEDLSSQITAVKREFIAGKKALKPGTVSVNVDSGGAVTDDGYGTISGVGKVEYQTGKILLDSIPSTSVIVSYHWYAEQDVIPSFDISSERSLTPQYGTSRTPQSIDIGTTANSGKITVKSSTVARILEAEDDPAIPDFDIMLKFIDPADVTNYILLMGTGCRKTAASAGTDPEGDLEIPFDISIGALTVTGSEA